MTISAVTGKGIPPLIHRIAELLEQLPPTLEEEDSETAAAEAAMTAGKLAVSEPAGEAGAAEGR